MLRFHEGEQVLVHRVRDELLDPVATGTVSRVYKPGESFLYNYVIEFNDRRVMVKDDWLAPRSSLIQEFPEFRDLQSS
jgi:hypothetical protein